MKFQAQTQHAALRLWKYIMYRIVEIFLAHSFPRLVGLVFNRCFSSCKYQWVNTCLPSYVVSQWSKQLGLPRFLKSETRFQITPIQNHTHTHNAKARCVITIDMRDALVLQFDFPYQIPNRNGVKFWAGSKSLFSHSSTYMRYIFSPPEPYCLSKRCSLWC